jgi:hypothetical protein
MLACISAAPAEDRLWFGTVREENTTAQARYELVVTEGKVKRIVYAPYGLTPTEFADVVHDTSTISFGWHRAGVRYSCLLREQTPTAYTGRCTAQQRSPLLMTIRQAGEEEEVLQGGLSPISEADLAILRRARELLHDGRSWSRQDDRVCDRSQYPYRWSLFCALHQASMEVDSEYRHLRPVMQAVRQAIEEQANGRQYPHILRDFNNTATNYGRVAGVLDRAETILRKR